MGPARAGATGRAEDRGAGPAPPGATGRAEGCGAGPAPPGVTGRACGLEKTISGWFKGRSSEPTKHVPHTYTSVGEVSRKRHISAF